MYLGKILTFVRDMIDEFVNLFKDLARYAKELKPAED